MFYCSHIFKNIEIDLGVIVMILGINAGHDASISVINLNGQIQSAIAEERLNRKKVFTGWPSKALGSVKSDRYHVAIAQNESSWSGMESRFYRFLFDDGVEYFDLFNQRSWQMSFASRRRIDVRPIIAERLIKQGIELASISYYDHHKCHAASAYYTSGFLNSLVITADGAGDGRSATAYTVINGEWNEISSTQLPHSPGHMYGWATKLLGYKVGRHEGKLTGLAAFGDVKRVQKLHGKFLEYEEHNSAFINPYLKGENYITFFEKLRCLLRNEAIHPSYEAFRRTVESSYGKDYRPEDIAALAQLELERAMVKWVSDLISRTGLSNVACAGGVFANVKLNQRIKEINDLKELWIFPDMGDGGLSVGAAYLKLNEFTPPVQSKALDDVYLGPEFSQDQIKEACIKANLSFKKVTNVASETAKLLANNSIVGWFQGRMEYGPRALGHRSILLHPGKREMNQVINARLNRTEFMPFAPSVLGEYTEELFDGYCKSDHASQFMTVTYDVRGEWLERLAAVAHVDGTARPQVVYKEREPLYWSVIEEFRKITGIPAVVNTSFNMHEEPIVCTPEDAIRSYLHGAVDVLILGDFFITKNVNE